MQHICNDVHPSEQEGEKVAREWRENWGGSHFLCGHSRFLPSLPFPAS